MDSILLVAQLHSSTLPPQNLSIAGPTAHTPSSTSPLNFMKKYSSCETLVTRIGRPGDSRNRQTADTIIRTCRLYRAGSSEHPSEVDGFIMDLDRGVYVPPYGYFDRPRVLHKLGVILWARFQQNTDLSDPDKSIALNEEALRLVPDGHEDQESIAVCLGRSFLRRLEVRGDLTDVDTSAGLVELGERVVMILDITSCGMPSEGLREQIALMSAADTALQQMAQEVGSSHIPEVQSLINEWRNQDGIPTRCKRKLGVLLSFLGGEGETKMHQLAVKLDWPFKEYKTQEMMQVLRDYMPYFQDGFTTKLGIALASTVLSTWNSVDDVLAAATTVCTL